MTASRTIITVYDNTPESHRLTTKYVEHMAEQGILINVQETTGTIMTTESYIIDVEVVEE